MQAWGNKGSLKELWMRKRAAWKRKKLEIQIQIEQKQEFNSKIISMNNHDLEEVIQVSNLRGILACYRGSGVNQLPTDCKVKYGFFLRGQARGWKCSGINNLR